MASVRPVLLSPHCLIWRRRAGQGCTIKAEMVINVEALSSGSQSPSARTFVQIAQTEGAGHLSPWVCPNLSWVTIWNKRAVK